MVERGFDFARLYPVYAVIGCGNGGQAMAGYLAMRGFKTILYNRSPGKLAAIQRAGGIALEGAISGFGMPDLLTDDLEEAVSNADVIMVTVPAHGHANLAIEASPHLRDGQIVVLHPGRTGGALEFRAVIKAAGCTANIIVAEAETFIYASRSQCSGRSWIFSVKHRVPVAALPASDTLNVLRSLRLPYPQFVPAANVLETSLNNIGALFHPAPTLLNSGRIEDGGESFEYYRQGITPSVARVIQTMDAERMAIARALGVRAVGVMRWLAEAYGAVGSTLYEAIQANPGYRGIGAPSSLNCRYLLEDVPTGLVPLESLGELAGVSTPTISGMISVGSAVCGMDFRAVGRTAARLGLKGLDPAEVWDLVAGQSHGHELTVAGR